MSSAFTMMFSCLQMKSARSLGIVFARSHCFFSSSIFSVFPRPGFALIQLPLSSMSSSGSSSAMKQNIRSPTSGASFPSIASVNRS